MSLSNRAYVPLQWAETFEHMMALTADRVDAFHQPVHLVGFSLGGYVAARYALEAPQKVASLTLVGYASDGLSSDEELQRQRTVSIINKGQYKGMNKVRMAQFVHSSRMGDEDLVDFITTMNNDLGGQVLKAQIISSTPRPSLTQALSQLTLPIHLIAADEDKIAPLEKMKSMADRFKFSQLHQVERAGHMMLLEQPEVVAMLLQRILANQSE